MSEPIVSRPEDAARLEHGAALVLDPLREFLDEAAIGCGDLDAEAIGDGHSNLSFLLRRGDDRFVLRRPPRGPLAPSANNVLREATVLTRLAHTAVPVPEVLASCSDPALIGAPFFVMSFVGGIALGDGLPREFDLPGAGEDIAGQLVDALVHLHAVDLDVTGLSELGKPDAYLERQLGRFGSLLERNATRPLADLEAVGDWLNRNRPESGDVTFVHGDYRLGNLLFRSPSRLEAVLDWEMATVGDPLADIGYSTAAWAQREDGENPVLALSRVTRLPGFPDRDWIVRRYAEATGRSVERLGWYQVLAMWKASIFLEGSYRRYLAGESTDRYFAGLGSGVPELARTALDRIHALEVER